MGEYITPTIPEQTAWSLIDEQSRLLARILASFSEGTVVSLQDLAGKIKVDNTEFVSQNLDYMYALGIVTKTENADQIFCYSLTPTFRGFLGRG